MQSPLIAKLDFRIIQLFPKFNSSCCIHVELLYYIVMTFDYWYCASVLNTRWNRSRHETKFHPNEVKLSTYHCSLCKCTSRKMSELEQHMRTQHSRFTNCCQACQLRLNSSYFYVQHATSVHSIPVFGGEFQPTQRPNQSAFNGSQSYSIGPTVDKTVLARDLPEFMKFKQGRIQELIDEKLSADPQKIPFFSRTATSQTISWAWWRRRAHYHFRYLSDDSCVLWRALKWQFCRYGGKKSSLCCSPLPPLKVGACLKEFFVSIQVRQVQTGQRLFLYRFIATCTKN